MATLKGQNFRIGTLVTETVDEQTVTKFKVFGMSTGCTITLNTTADDAGTKDDVGMAAKPIVTAKSWQVSVDTLNVIDAAAMLTAIKSLTPFTLMWDETSTVDNQTPEGAAFARKGSAFLSDLTLTFNNREKSAKNLQFSGSGAIETAGSDIVVDSVPAGTYSMGQFTRLYLGSDNTATPASVIAAALQLSLHISMTLEDASTKDTAGDWLIQEPTALNYDISTTALVRSGETITSQVAGKTLADIESIYEAGTPVKFQIANVSGANQRTKGGVIISGSVIISTLTMNGPNRGQNADYTAQLSGYGIYTVGA
jgi:hypothetical protein